MNAILHSMLPGIISAARMTHNPGLLTGPTGVGKSQGLLDYAVEHGIGHYEIRAGSIDTHIMTGIYVPNHELKVTMAYPCAEWPTTQNIQKGIFEQEGLLVIEELGNAPSHVTPHLLGVLNERRVGQDKLGDGWTIFATSNRLEDRSGIRSMAATELNRMATYLVLCPFDEWQDWAIQNGVRPEILSYFAGAPDELNESEMMEQDPEDPQKRRRRVIPPNRQFCSPRSATKLSREIDAWIAGSGGTQYPPTQVFEAFVGERIAGPLSAWAAVMPGMPTWREIVADPMTAKLPSGFGPLYYTSTMMAQQVDRRTVPQFARYLRRLGNHEFAASTWRLAEQVRPEVIKTGEYQAHVAGIGGVP